MKKVSVIMATYKTKTNYLREAIYSILEQTYKNIELIIIADGDKENYQTIEEINDPRIKLYLNDENIGLPASLNKALEYAQGDYIARMDADDISIKNRIENQVKYLEKRKDIDILGTFAIKIGEKKGISMYPWYDSESIKAQLLFRCILIHPTIMIRRDFLYNNKLKYNENFYAAQDFELWSRALEKGKIAVIPFIGLKLRIHNSQISQAKKAIQLENTKKILLKNIEYIFNSKEQEDVILKGFLVLGKKEKITNQNNETVLKTIQSLYDLETEKVDKRVLIKQVKVLYFLSLINSKKIRITNFKYWFSITTMQYLTKKIIITLKCQISYLYWRK